MPGSTLTIVERSVDSPRPLKVTIVGAGVSGIILAIKLQESIKDLELQIFEKNQDLGGTWWENRYPGCACDIPAHVYQLSWESNPAWSRFYASGTEILKYWQQVSKKYDIRKYMKFSHRVDEARWSADTASWSIKVADMSTGHVENVESDIFISATGALNLWQWPSIPGLKDFQGKLMHSAAWDENFEIQGKRVAVIGGGSSGIQIVPSLQPAVERLDHYVRGRTWIATPMGAEELQKRGEESNFEYSAEEISAWEKDPSSYLRYRKQVEEVVQKGYDITMKGSTAQEQAKAYFATLMAERLSKKTELLGHILPDFPPLCKRLTPGPGYLEALTENNVDVIVSPIEAVTKSGIKTVDGTLREVDAIVCATGFNTHFTNRFPVYGINGTQLFEENSARPRLSTYLSTMVDGFPNMFMLLGPNSGLGAGNLLIVLESLADYCVAALRKMQMENIRTIQPSAKATNAFTKYCDTYFQRTVFSAECTSWYKTDGRVAALWPGSSLHAIKALKHPRWEDLEYTYVEDNEMGWFGNGTTEADLDETADKSYYLTSLSLVKVGQD